VEEQILRRDDEFAALPQTQESTAAALTDAIVRLSRIEAQFARAPAALDSTILSNFPEIFAEFR
jgi:hypothetical protein